MSNTHKVAEPWISLAQESRLSVGYGDSVYLLYKRIRTIEFDFSARITHTIRFDRCGKIEIWITGSRLFLLLSSLLSMRTPYVRRCYDTQNTYRRCSVKCNITFAPNNVADEKCTSTSLCFGHGFMYTQVIYTTHHTSHIRYPGSNVPLFFFLSNLYACVQILRLVLWSFT